MGYLVAKRRRVGKKFIKNIYNDLRTTFFSLSFRIFFMSYPKDFVLRSILLFFLFIFKKITFFFSKYFLDDYIYDYYYYFSKKNFFLAYKRSLPIWEKNNFCQNNFLSLGKIQSKCSKKQ